jgi:hypothetical protein
MLSFHAGHDRAGDGDVPVAAAALNAYADRDRRRERAARTQLFVDGGANAIERRTP